MRECCSVHTWNDNLRDSLPHLNTVVTPETCSVANESFYLDIFTIDIHHDAAKEPGYVIHLSS